ncbi:MAG: alkaline phosphatase D family protein [Oleibacter sp.]|nr:alkaline phosphatase D family protein [Thalassolituus sp.]
MPLSRREFLSDSLASSLSLPFFNSKKFSSQASVFCHGIASGDPLVDGIILWTRITPRTPKEYVSYRWVMSTTQDLSQVVAEGTGTTGPERDHTVKIDVRALQSGTQYYYAFEALNQWSDIGRTKTLPEGTVEHLRIAFTSCSNFAQGYFNVYREIAQRTDLDVVLHLGDYIYEYANVEESLTSGRINQPLTEITTLTDYRQRHACYKADADSQDVHRQHPFLLIWDDHEIANNAWRDGADNHDELTQGRWADRIKVAVQAYYEWMPVREPDGQDRYSLYRGYRFGNLLDLTMLDTRLAGRDAPTDVMVDRDRPERTLLGAKQEQWLEERLSDAKQANVTWTLFGQQVMMAQLGTNTQPFNYDQWDGYPAARQRVFDSIRRHQVNNWVVLTGDIHSSWAMTLHDDPFNSTNEPVGIELITPAVTSPGITNKPAAQLAASSLTQLLPHLNFVDFYYRGFVVLDMTPERLQAEWWVVDRVDTPRYKCDCLRALMIENGQKELKESTPIRPEIMNDELPAFSRDLTYFRQWQSPVKSQAEPMIAGNP